MIGTGWTDFHLFFLKPDRTENNAFELFLKIIEPDQTDDSVISVC
jgi:hypothetical protein